MIDEVSPSEDERAAEAFLKNDGPSRAASLARVINNSVRFF